jgi:hypothetical protein
MGDGVAALDDPSPDALYPHAVRCCAGLMGSLHGDRERLVVAQAAGGAELEAGLSFAKNRSDRKPCSIRTLANEMNQVKGRVKVAADNHVTQRYVPLHPASRFSRTTRYRCGNFGLSSRCVFGEPQPRPDPILDHRRSGDEATRFQALL